MATITKTFIENYRSYYQSTWTVSVTQNNITVSDVLFRFAPTVQAKYVYSGKDTGSAIIRFDTTINGYTSYYKYQRDEGSWASGSISTLTETFPISSILTENIFNSGNPTQRTVDIIASSTASADITLTSKYGNSMSNSYQNLSAVDWGTIATVTLNAPPTFDVSTLTKDTSVYVAGATGVSVTVSNATAKYGGNITSATLTVGSQSESISGNGTISMTLQNAGTFTPTVTVTDSRGQTATESLAQITVLQYENPTVSFDVFRTDDTGVRADEGHNGLITATFTYMDAVSSLAEPEVQINGFDISQTVGASITWYTALTQSGAVDTTTEIDDWGDIASGATVYGLLDGNYDVTGNFSEGESYLIGLIAKDSRNKTSALITQTLSTAFYTVDFKAGGKEIAFGAPANDDLTDIDGIDCSDKGLFKCNMDALFRDRNDGVRLLFDFVYPVGSYYETSKSQAEFDPNDVWGGTWILETGGMVHVSSGSGYSINHADDNSGAGAKDGGEATHVLTPPETAMKNHSHTMSHKHGMSHTHSHNHLTGGWIAKQSASGTVRSVPCGYTNTSRAGQFSSDTDATASSKSNTDEASTSSTGGQTEANGSAHNNMQPYIIINRWHRTA